MKSILHKVFVVAAVLVGMGTGVAQAAPIITNGSFESNTGCSPTGWAYTVCSGGGVRNAADFGVPASNGKNVLWMFGTDNGGTDVLSQTITGLTIGNSYTLSFDMAPEAGSNVGRPGAFMLMNLTGSSIASNRFSAFDPNPNGCCWAPWNNESLTFMATATSAAISMHGDISQGPSWEFLLDNFAIADNGGTVPVPEPGSIALFAVALAGLKFTKSKKLNSAQRL